MRQTTNGNAIKVSGGKSNSPPPLPPMSICSYQTCSPTCDKFAGCPSFAKELPSPRYFSSVHQFIPKCRWTPSIPLFFPLNSSDTWPFSLPPRVFQGFESTHTFVSPSLNVSSSLSGKERNRIEERKSKWVYNFFFYKRRWWLFKRFERKVCLFNVIDHSEQAWSLRDIRIFIHLLSDILTFKLELSKKLTGF